MHHRRYISQLAGYISKAMERNRTGVVPPRATKAATPKPIVVPPELAAALDRHPDAAAAFAAMSPSHRREYAEWMAEAKRETTKATRIAKTLAQLTEKKSLNWKYNAC